MLAGAATAGAFLGDLIAPRLPANLREEAVVIGCLIGAGVGATLSFFAFELVVLVLFATVVGASSELGRLAFQTLMQRLAPGGSYGRVFVRYEILFQLAWVGGALIPALAPIDLPRGLPDPGRALPRRDHRVPDAGHPRAPARMRFARGTVGCGRAVPGG